MQKIKIQPLTAQAFAPFGQVIEKRDSQHFPINAGKCERFHDLCSIDLLGDGARPMISIFQGTHYALPLSLKMVERHPLGSQAFFPLECRPYLAIVCEDDNGTPVHPKAFLARGDQGVNYPAGQWHGVLTPIDEDQNFIVIDRGGDGNNLEEYHFEQSWLVESETHDEN